MPSSTTAMEQKHTPAPWEVAYEVSATQRFPTVIARIDGRIVGISSPWMNDQAEANAAHIVHCVNSHASLVEALGEARKALELTNKFLWEEVYTENCTGPDSPPEPADQVSCNVVSHCTANQNVIEKLASALRAATKQD